MLLNLHEFEIKKEIKKLFEMPNKSLIDLTYFIKNEINDEENINLDINILKNIGSDDINNKRFLTPKISLRNKFIFPSKSEINNYLNNKKDDDDLNLTTKFFSKITDKYKVNNINDSIEIINFYENKGNTEIDTEIYKKYDKFCSAIFIAGLKPPIEKSSIIELSKNFISSCGHKKCSNLLALKPDLISIYLNKDFNISNESNYLLANLCFPLGIKICFSNINEMKNKEEYKIYYNIIKNEKDEIYYMTTLQYFVQTDFKNFKDKYKFDIISYYKKELNLKKVFKDDFIIYIPESLTLLSKYPFYISMNICLNIILLLPSAQDKNYLINHLINENHIPDKLITMLFYIPIIKEPIELNHPFNIYDTLLLMSDKQENPLSNISKYISTTQINSKIILNKIPIENIIFIFQLLLLEQQILIVENNYEILSEIILTLISIIYPLKWINSFLPILSLNTVQFLQTPIPFIMGLDEYLLKYALNSKNIYIGKEVIIYHISSKSFILGKNKKSSNKKDIFNELKLNFFPKMINDFLLNKLKKCKINLKKENEVKIDMDIRLIFIKAMILLIGDYNNYIFYTKDENSPLFNKEAFIEAHKEKQSKLFLRQMINTQIFNQFIFNEKQSFLNDKNINNNDNIDIKNNYENISYFKKFIEKYPEYVNNKNLFNVNTDESHFNFKQSRNRSIVNSKKFKNKNIFYNNFLNSQKENKLTIDFDKLEENPLNLNNLSKSHNLDNNKKSIDFSMELKINNIKKPISNEYKNNNIKKKNEIKKFLLFPYFLKKINYNTTNYNIIYEHIINYNKENKYELFDFNEKNKKRNYIFPITKINFDFSKINSLNRKYYIIKSNVNNYQYEIIKDNNIKNIYDKKPYINTVKELSATNIISNNININSNIFKTKIQKEIDIQDKNCDFIKKLFSFCLTNKQQITKSQFSSLELLLSQIYYQNFFSNLLIQDFNKEYKIQNKQLTTESFSDVIEMIKLCFNNLKEKEYNTGRKLTIACFFYYEIDSENNMIYIYQILNEENIRYKIWEDDYFWINFFKIEVDESKKYGKEFPNNSKENKNFIENKSEFDIIKENSLYISKIMIKLNLKKEIIYKIFSKIILPIYENAHENINIIMNEIKSLS